MAATRHEIKCINKSDRQNPHERILRVGGVDGNGTRWKISQQEAVQYIKQGEFAFFVRKNGHEVKVIVAVSHFGNEYIKTEADGETPNNLLSLPECP